MMQAPMLQSPPQPEVSIAHIVNAISVRWSNFGTLAASYVVEVFDYASSASNRFGCQAPADGATSLELCIQGLQAGQSYVACIRSVAQDGSESAPSPWSRVVTLPVVVQPMPSPVVSSMGQCGNTLMPPMPSPVGPQQSQPISPQCHAMPSSMGQSQQLSSPHAMLNSEKSHEMCLAKSENFGTTIACPPPEITGHEDTGLFLD